MSLFSDERPLTWQNFWTGLHFSVPFLSILTIHEFGHYIAARIYRVSVSLPYYLPLWLGFLGVPSIGTAGAFIKIRSGIRTRAAYFDIGAAGPLAGFVAAVGVLVYGFYTLPSHAYIFSIHPEYIPFGSNYADYVYQEEGAYLGFGVNLLFDFLSHTLADPSKLPHAYEMVHYPYLFAGYLALFFTALNLLPIGQLDGGHVLYALVGKEWHSIVSRLALLVLLFYSGLEFTRLHFDTTFLLTSVGYLIFLYLSLRKFTSKWQIKIFVSVAIFLTQVLFTSLFPHIEGYTGWMLFAFLLGNVLGISHPRAYYEARLSPLRTVLAYVTWIVFLLCFSAQPFTLS